jgi:7-cyano-7-deazaguanine reductase
MYQHVLTTLRRNRRADPRDSPQQLHRQFTQRLCGPHGNLVAKARRPISFSNKVYYLSGNGRKSHAQIDVVFALTSRDRTGLSSGRQEQRVAQKPKSGAKTSAAAPLGVSQLGAHVATPHSPDEATMERVPNPHSDTTYVARFVCPEFTSLCPVTGQPDFGHLVIDYVPRDWLVESKSLKLFLQSHRNHGAFHEDCTVGIGKRLVSLLDPHFLRIGGYWYPRGGMPIDVFYQTGEPPKGVWLPDQGVTPYRGRG